MSSLLTSNFRQSFIRMSPLAKILLVIFMVVFFLVVSSILALLVAIPLFNLKLNEILRIISFPDADNIGVVKFFQTMESVFLFLVPALLAAWLYSDGILKYLKADTNTSGITILLVLFSWVAAIPMMNALAVFNAGMELPQWMNSVEMKIRTWEENAERLTELFLAGESNRDLVLNLFMIGLLPALGEEFLFRGVFQRLFIEWTKNKHVGIWMAAIFFSFIHFQFYGFLPRLLLGLYFGYLLVWSSSIWVPIAGHFINNGFAVIYYHFADKPVGDTAMDKLGTGPSGHLGLYLSVFFTSVLLGLIFLQEKSRKGSFR
jgi:uncharacterized protein